jgi:light-regulated signal transduction histidine kinase (bacteriophytochrome)
MSPIHLKYLKNMGVRSSMSISIVINGNLWGLIACHSYGDAAIRVTLPVRELCRNIGECAATNIERLFMIERIKARQNPRSTPPPQNPSSFIAASSVDLLRVFGADFGLLSIQDEARTIGKLEPYREALAILAHLQSRRFTSIFSSQNVNKTFPNIKYPPGIHTIAGLLIMPLSVNSNDFLVFFRKGQLQEIRWAGNPYEKLLKPGTDYLEPRMSFQRWTEKVVGLSTEWTEDQLETASVLSLLYGRFIEIWRQKESAGQTNRMTRLLLRNSSHEVRTPLNAIINYLELALENNLDNNTRELLSKAHNASRSLIYVIDDLLNLTKAEGVPLAASGETFDLGATVSEVITSFRKEAIRKGLDLTVSTHQGIPEMVKGDASRLRQVLSNVTSNAFQHSVDGGIKVDIKPLITKDNISVICITVQDAGLGMSEDQLDVSADRNHHSPLANHLTQDLFREFEEVFDDQSQFFSSDTTSSTARSDETGSLGVGLAVVARYVRNMNGTIRVQSELGKGTIFGIELPFEHISTTPPLSLPPSSPYSMPALRALSDTSNTPVATPLTPGEKKSNKPSVLPIPESEDASRMISLEARTGISLSSRSITDGYPFPQMNTTANDSQGESLNVLMAEDNPINSRLLSRRLQKLGHSVEITVDGQECGDHFKTDPEGVDVILMDIQVCIYLFTVCILILK